MPKSVEVRGKSRSVSPDQLRANPLNDNYQSPFMFGKLLSTIQSEGFSDPIIARSGDQAGPFKDGKLEIIGGEHRWKAAQKLGMAKVPVWDLGDVPDTQAKKLLINLNKLHGDSNADALSRIVREISESGGADALESLALDEDTLRDMLDGDADVVLGEDDGAGATTEADEALVSLGAGVSARDILVVLDVKGLKEAELSDLVDTVRQWSFGRADQNVPGWRDLMALLKANTRQV